MYEKPYFNYNRVPLFQTESRKNTHFLGLKTEKIKKAYIYCYTKIYTEPGRDENA